MKGDQSRIGEVKSFSRSVKSVSITEKVTIIPKNMKVSKCLFLIRTSKDLKFKVLGYR